MRLTADNTAVVLDSTADLPDAQLRHPNWRMVPLYVRFGEDVYRDYLDLTPGAVLRAAGASRPSRRARRSRPPRTSRPCSPSWAATSACSASSSPRGSPGTYESACLAAAETGGERVVVLDSTVASGGTVLLADAVQRRLERGTDDDEIRALVPRYAAEARSLLHGGHARLPRARRPGRPRGRVRGPASVREADPLDPGRRGRPGEAGPRPREGAGRARRRLRARRPSTARASTRGSPTRSRRSRRAASPTRSAASARRSRSTS